jgi:hypothetical protein
MHNASNNKKTNDDVSVRLSRKTWDKVGEFTIDSKLKKKQQVDVIVEEHDRIRKSLKGGPKKK